MTGVMQIHRQLSTNLPTFLKHKKKYVYYKFGEDHITKCIYRKIIEH